MHEFLYELYDTLYTPLNRSKSFDDSVVSAMFGENQETEI